MAGEQGTGGGSIMITDDQLSDLGPAQSVETKTIDEIMQATGCDEETAHHILAIETGDENGDLEPEL